MNLSQGDLVLLPYPFSNLKGVKVRPALVISGDKFNFDSGDFIAVPLTSVISNGYFSVLVMQNNLSFGKLVKISEVRCDKVFCASRSLIKMKIGKLKSDVFSEVRRKILDIFD